jgi:hypothetical protein
MLCEVEEPAVRMRILQPGSNSPHNKFIIRTLYVIIIAGDCLLIVTKSVLWRPISSYGKFDRWKIRVLQQKGLV